MQVHIFTLKPQNIQVKLHILHIFYCECSLSASAPKQIIGNCYICSLSKIFQENNPGHPPRTLLRGERDVLSQTLQLCWFLSFSLPKGTVSELCRIRFRTGTKGIFSISPLTYLCNDRLDVSPENASRCTIHCKLPIYCLTCSPSEVI